MWVETLYYYARDGPHWQKECARFSAGKPEIGLEIPSRERQCLYRHN